MEHHPPGSAPLRVGSVPYLVARPLDWGLAEEPGISLVYDVPARLVQRLRAGELDVALVSSIELFRQPGYRYIDGLAVSGRGFVSSVQVFLKKPIDEVHTIALDPSSRTAATLVRVLLGDAQGQGPDFFEVPPGEDPRQTGCEAWLRIGDPALVEYLTEGGHEVYNPSEHWCTRTGLPFIFAAWIVRPGTVIEPHLPAFLRSRERGRRHLAELTERAVSEWGLPQRASARYFYEECVYEPGEEMRASLRTFRDAAAGLGLCEAQHDPEPTESILPG